MNEESPLTDIQTIFYDNFVPPLKANQYTVTVSQTLTVDTQQTQQDGGNPHIINPPQPPLSQTFIVRGPRFVLGANDVHRVFPPDNGIGAYDSYLPMIVFNKRSLPWERELSLTLPKQDRYPWLALLVFTADELLPPPSLSGNTMPPLQGSQQNLTGTASLPLNMVVHATYDGKSTVGPPTDTLGPTITLEIDEDPDKIYCSVIDIAADTFSALIPTINDLPFLAHVRQVSTENKEPLNTVHDGWFSVLSTNRFAIPPSQAATVQQRNIVHLVSLEGFEEYLGTETPIHPSGFKKVRLISLYSWTYNCITDPQENFRQLMLHLISSNSEQGTDLLLRMPLPDPLVEPDPGIEQQVITRILHGNTPLSYSTHSGEQTFAWYSGPLAPVVATPFLEAVDLQNPEQLAGPQNVSEAMVYDPSTGLFDQSYAVAFQTGRSLALASRPFATNLLQWRRKAHYQVDMLMETLRSPHLIGILQREHLVDSHGNLMDGRVDELTQLLSGHNISQAFKHFLAGEFRDRIVPRIGRASSSTSQKKRHTPDRFVAVKPTDLQQLTRHPAVIALLHQLSGLASSTDDIQPFQSDILPEQVIQWLAQTTLLYNVPFNNLIPNSRMLPQESIRFFYINQNWINSLLDGALSVGIQSSRDRLFHQLMRNSLYHTVRTTLYQVRDRQRNIQSNQRSLPLQAMAGFVLRSAGVVGWPGLEIKAWSASSPNPMQPLRLDRVSPDTMLALYPDIPIRIEFNEPAEGLVSGIVEGKDKGIAIRYLPGTQGATSTNIGQAINVHDPAGWLTPDEIQKVKRSQPKNQPALRIAGLGGLVDALQKKFPGTPPVLSPASFAIQMVRVPEQMLFERKQEGAK